MTKLSQVIILGLLSHLAMDSAYAEGTKECFDSTSDACCESAKTNFESTTETCCTLPGRLINCGPLGTVIECCLSPMGHETPLCPMESHWPKNSQECVYFPCNYLFPTTVNILTTTTYLTGAALQGGVVATVGLVVTCPLAYPAGVISACPCATMSALTRLTSVCVPGPGPVRQIMDEPRENTEIIFAPMPEVVESALGEQQCDQRDPSSYSAETL